VFSHEMENVPVERFRRIVIDKKKRRPTAILFLTTAGGDADAAYRLAACLKRLYASFSVYIFGRCKSAGTLAILGAQSIVLGDSGELGPLDVQLAKRDELFARASGLDIFQALSVLNNAAFECFEQAFLSLIAKSGGNISAKMAAEVAREIATGLFSPMTAQIDPERLGEIQRATNIANAYGEKLDSGNLRRGALEKLVEGYPSHSFVIDFPEAKTIFRTVRQATLNETAIAEDVPGTRNQTSVIFDLEEYVGVAPIPTRGAGNAAKAKAKRPASRRAGRGRTRRAVAPVGDVAGNAEAAEEHADADEGGALRQAGTGRRARARPRLVQDPGA